MLAAVNINFFSRNIRSFFRSQENNRICNFLRFAGTTHRNIVDNVCDNSFGRDFQISVLIKPGVTLLTVTP